MNITNNYTNLDTLKSKVKNTKEDDKKLMKACEDIEAEFLKIMLKEMKKTIPKDSLFEKSQGREIFEDLYAEELAVKSSKCSSLGLAKSIYDQFNKTYIKK
ncbi:rod-binding protein [Tepidibacter aestuarii]|uniref:rod-binding protein n=1 Tax=Tepidibacter aestuarii TaxID=2925782 RepID=UPI0020C16B4B|nr:rod-binding protein [Tepidibacter aestuarii]CAH2211866.1 Flagellar protein FlgJ [Tepidibacter aestuarii]